MPDNAEREAPINPGDRVQITPSEAGGWLECQWWPKGTVTGTAQRVFKNGRVAVAVDQIRNTSEDGVKTLHFLRAEVQLIDGDVTNI